MRRLQDAGFEANQAEAVADAFKEAQGEAEVATKRDIARLESRFDARFERVDGELRLNRWMLTFVIGIGLTILFKLFV